MAANRGFKPAEPFPPPPSFRLPENISNPGRLVLLGRPQEAIGAEAMVLRLVAEPHTGHHPLRSNPHTGRCYEERSMGKVADHVDPALLTDNLRLDRFQMNP
jgi:hypothetical protein